MNLFYLHLIIRKIIPQIIYRIIIFFLLTLFWAFLFRIYFKEVSRKNCARKGLIFINEVWSGEIKLSGDIVILPFTKVVILPGTKIIVQANQDECRSGSLDIIDEMTKEDPTSKEKFSQTHTSLSVYGTLTAKGGLAPEEKIIFTSSSENPTETDWNGILFYGRFAKGILENCIVEWCHYGPALHSTNQVVIKNNLIRHCFWGGIHTFKSSPVLENNEVYLCGHEAFDIHEGSPVIKNNIIGHCLTAVVVNNSNKKRPVVFENNKIYYCANLMCVQDNAWIIIRNNKFMSSDNLPMRFSYKGFTIPFDTKPMGIELCDNVQAVIYDNYFSGCKEYTITYTPVGPNKKIRHTTHHPEKFEITGAPKKITITNNTFARTAPVTIRKKGKNVEIKNNTWIR